MGDIPLEILKRYLVLQLLESGSVKNSKELMQEVNANALETAKTLQGINAMFGNRNTTPPPPPVQNPFNQPPPMFNQPPAYSNTQIIEMMNGMQKQFIDMQNQMFSGLQELYNTLQQLVLTIDNQNKNNQNNQNMQK